MVIKDIERPKENFKLLIEQQRVDDRLYEISDSYAPSLGSVGIRISVSVIDEEKERDYRTVHGLDFRDGEINSYYLISDKNDSCHGSAYLNDPMAYYEEVMNAFDYLVNSGISEFTAKALAVVDKIRENVNKIGSGKNAI